MFLGGEICTITRKTEEFTTERKLARSETRFEKSEKHETNQSKILKNYSDPTKPKTKKDKHVHFEVCFCFINKIFVL